MLIPQSARSTFVSWHFILNPDISSPLYMSPTTLNPRDGRISRLDCSFITVTWVMSADLLHNIFLFVFPIFLPDFHSSTFLFCFSHSHQIHLVLFHEFFSLQVSFGSHASEKISTFIWKSYWKYYAASFIDNLKGFQNWLQK